MYTCSDTVADWDVLRVVKEDGSFLVTISSFFFAFFWFVCLFVCLFVWYFLNKLPSFQIDCVVTNGG